MDTANKEKTKIFIVDDHSVFILGLRTLFNDCDQFDIVGEANTGNQAIEQIETLQIKDLVILLDYKLSDGDGVDFIPRIKDICPNCQVLLLSGHSQIDYIIKALRMGAAGYISKEKGMDQMVISIQNAIGQEYYLDPHLSGIICKHLIETPAECKKSQKSMAPLSNRLTERQIAFLRFFAKRKSHKEIAGLLRVTPNTVYVMKSQVKDRLEVQKDEDLYQICLEYGLS